MKFNAYFIMAFFILILSVSAVSAEDNLGVDGNSTSDLINDSGAASPDSTSVNKNWTSDEFLNNYNSIQDNDVVLIRNGTGNLTESIVLSQNGVTIFAEGNVSFDGQGNKVHFEIAGNNVLIKGITFKNFNFTGDGGAISWSGVNGTLVNCSFINNTAYNGNGGAVYWKNSGFMTNCSFVNTQWIKSNGIFAESDLAIDGGEGVVDVIVGGALSGVSITVSNNETYYLSPDESFNLTGKIMSGNLTIVDGTNDVFKFKVDGTEIADNPVQISNDGQYFMAYTSTTPATVAVTANYTKANSTSAYRGSTLVFKEELLSPDLNVTAYNITYGENATVTVTVNSNATGKVNATVNGTVYEGDVVDGEAVLIISGLDAGSYIIDVNYEGDDKFAGATATTAFDVAKASANMVVDVKNINYGDNATVTVTLNYNTTGKVNVTVNGTVYEGDVVDGEAVFTLFDLGIGTYNVSAIYFGDSNFIEADVNATFTVNKANPMMDVDVVTFEDGTKANITVTVNEEATGVLSISIDGNAAVDIVIDDGKANYTLDNLTSGIHNLTVNYGGDNNFTNYSKTIIFSTGSLDPSLGVNIENIIYGNNATVTISVNASATGNVTVIVNGIVYEASIVDGNATLVLTGLDAGSYIVEVSYVGDGKFTGANVIKELIVSKAKARLIIEVKDMDYGDNAIITVNVNANATGKVNVSVNGKTETLDIVDGRATLVLDCPDATKYGVFVVYDGDNNFIGTYAMEEFVVFKINTDMAIDIKNTDYGNNVTITVTVNPKATGKVNITVNNTTYEATIMDGKATLSVEGLDLGFYNVSVTYLGDNNFKGAEVYNNFTVVLEYALSSDDVVKYFRNGTQYQVTLKTSSGIPLAGEKVIVIIVNAKKTNPVAYTIITNDNGVATLAINTNPGIYYITAIYANKSVENQITVLEMVYSINANHISMTYKDGTSYTARLTYNNGIPIANATLSLILNNKGLLKEYKVLTDENGIASLPINLYVGQYTITAKYMKEAITTNVDVLSGGYKFLVKDVVKYFKNGTQYSVKVTDLKGNPISNQKVVTTLASQTWSKNMVYILTTDEDGVATLTINLNPGKYTIKSGIGSSSVQSTITVLPTLTSASLTKSVNKAGDVVAKLVDGHGKPVAGKKITFTVKAKQYTKITDKDGIAKLPINLGVGKWAITIAEPETNAKTTANVIITKARA